VTPVATTDVVRSSLPRPAPARSVAGEGAKVLHVRWLGQVRYRDALALQHGLFASARDNHLLLLEHPHVFTLGARGDASNILVDPASINAEVVAVDRGGDVTYHGPGQLVGYPILSLAGKRGGGMADTSAYVHSVEDLMIDALDRLGLPGCGRLDDYPGVWVDPEGPSPRKIAAIGVRLTRGRTMHGFALNVDPDMSYFDAIVPCGIPDKAVTSLAAEGLVVTMRDVVGTIAELAVERWGSAGHDRQDVVGQTSADDRPPLLDQGDTPVRLQARRSEAGVSGGLTISERKPEWMRVKANLGPEYRQIKSVMSELDLNTVCEEAGCPNIFECWADGTATFMILGERCTRACRFCLVDTRKPVLPDAHEPAHVAEAVERMGLEYAVVTMVARDDLADGGAAHVSATIEAIRERSADVKVEVLVSDFQGDPGALATVFGARPHVFAHNVETVARLQRAVRPSAGYARSLAVLSRAKIAGLVTKTSIMVGLGETFDEVAATLADLACVGTDIVTIGQYLRPTAAHLPVHRWWTPGELTELAGVGRALGIGHVESSPLTRSSYHAKSSAASIS
jgi:lipoyl synthase